MALMSRHPRSRHKAFCVFWGISCKELKAEWAAQRIKDLSLKAAILSMIRKPGKTITSLIEEFHYPRRGPGMMWTTFKKNIEQRGGTVRGASDTIISNDTSVSNTIFEDGFESNSFGAWSASVQ